MFEIIYFYKFLIKFYNFLLYKNLNNFLYFYKIFNLTDQIKYIFFYNKKLSSYLNTKINYKINNLNFKLLNNDKKISKNFFINKNNTNFNKKFFNLFFLFTYSMYNSYFKVNNVNTFFYLKNVKNKIIIIDLKKFSNRWNDAYNLIFNIFYYNFNALFFGTNLFKNETLALNWNYNYFDINLWKYYFPFFIFKLNNYNKKTDFFFDKLNNFNINFIFVTDCHYHYKNIHYLKKKSIYTLGLVNINLNPWLVDYPLISFFENFLIQSFFFKLIIYINKKVLFDNYKYFKKIWINFLFSKNYFI